VALRTEEQLTGLGFLLAGEAVAAVGTGGWREGDTVAVWDRRTGECHAAWPTYHHDKAVPKASAAGGLGLWWENNVVWVKGKGKGAALSISPRPIGAAGAFAGPMAVVLTQEGEASRRDLTAEGVWQPCWPERKGEREVLYTALALAPDGSRAALGLTACRVEVLDWPGGGGAVELPALPAKNPDALHVLSLGFSPDGKLLAAASGQSGYANDPALPRVPRSGGVALYDLGKNELRASVLTPKDDVMAVAFSPDGSYLFFGSTDCTVRALDVTTKKEVAVLSGHVGCVNALAFSPDGNALASAGSDGLVRLWPWRELLARPAEAPPAAARKRSGRGSSRTK
jgi:WD40 repeat protein